MSLENIWFSQARGESFSGDIEITSGRMQTPTAGRGIISHSFVDQPSIGNDILVYEKSRKITREDEKEALENLSENSSFVSFMIEDEFSTAFCWFSLNFM